MILGCSFIFKSEALKKVLRSLARAEGMLTDGLFHMMIRYTELPFHWEMSQCWHSLKQLAFARKSVGWDGKSTISSECWPGEGEGEAPTLQSADFNPLLHPCIRELLWFQHSSHFPRKKKETEAVTYLLGVQERMVQKF